MRVIARRTCLAGLLIPAVLLALGSVASAVAQEPMPEPVPSSQVAVAVDTGLVENTGTAVGVIYSTTVSVPKARWLRLDFAEVQLAGDLLRGTESYLLLTALEDGAIQVMNAAHVAQWGKTSAYFNGEAVRIELVAHPETGPNRLVMTEVTAGEAPASGTRSICGPTDDRALSNDPRAGRILPVGCTGWMINDCAHCFLTAGHCAYNTQVVEFNVPLSNPDGSLNHPPPEDQYAVDPASMQDNGGQGVGDDWAYFGCFPNSNTGLTPFEAQGQAFDLIMPPPVSDRDIRITGYGSVSPPVSMTWYQVQKTHAGPYVTFSGTTVQYRTDTTGGNSGSPVIDEISGRAIGIHTHGGCTSTGGENSGTGANHSGLQAALADPRGVCAASALAFGYPDGLPTMVLPAGGTTVHVEVSASGGTAPQPDTGQFHYDIGAGVVTVPMQQLSDNLYEAVFPPSDCETVVEFFFSAAATSGVRYYDPGGCFPPAAGYTAISAYSIVVSVDDPFETDTGWTVGAPDDDATTGVWNRMDSQGTAAQPEDDHTPAPGVVCWVTDGRAGSGVGDYDVDNGKTTLFSPVYDLSAVLDARISYWRWYSNDEGSTPNTDIFVVDVSNDGGSSWANVETVGPAGPGTSGGWIYYEFQVTDVTSPTAAVRLRFVASDEGSGSIVEAALDDLRITVVNCQSPECPGDLNGDGQVGLADLAQLLAHYGTPSGASYEDGDLDGDGDVDLSDLGALLAVYGTTCW